MYNRALGSSTQWVYLLFKRGVHIQFLAVSPPSLNRVVSHLDTRPNLVTSVCWKDLQIMSALFLAVYDRSMAHANIMMAPSLRHTFVLLHPNRNAASCANNSPKPNINPFTNGRRRFIAAPRNMLQKVGGEYSIIGLDESEGGSSEES